MTFFKQVFSTKHNFHENSFIELRNQCSQNILLRHDIILVNKLLLKNTVGVMGERSCGVRCITVFIRALSSISMAAPVQNL